MRRSERAPESRLRSAAVAVALVIACPGTVAVAAGSDVGSFIERTTTTDDDGARTVEVGGETDALATSDGTDASTPAIDRDERSLDEPIGEDTAGVPDPGPADTSRDQPDAQPTGQGNEGDTSDLGGNPAAPGAIDGSTPTTAQPSAADTPLTDGDETTPAAPVTPVPEPNAAAENQSPGGQDGQSATSAAEGNGAAEDSAAGSSTPASSTPGANTPDGDTPNDSTDDDDTGAIGAALRLAVVALTALVIGAAAVFGVRAVARMLATRSSQDPTAPTVTAGASLGPSGARLDRLRQELEAEPDPALAIRRGYAFIEDGFGVEGLARRPGEAPVGYLERALPHLDGADHELARLTALFLTARYSPHPVNDSMRSEAVDAVIDLRRCYLRAS